MPPSSCQVELDVCHWEVGTCQLELEVCQLELECCQLEVEGCQGCDPWFVEWCPTCWCADVLGTKPMSSFTASATCFFITAAIFEELESLLLLLLLDFFLCPFLVDFFLLTCFLFFSELCFPIVETKQTGQLLKSVYKINILMLCVEVWHTEIKM